MLFKEIIAQKTANQDWLAVTAPRKYEVTGNSGFFVIFFGCPFG